MQSHPPRPPDSDAPAQWAGVVADIARAQPGLRAFLRALLPCPGDADDVLQETNLVLWQKRAEFDPARPFGPWARRVAYFQTLAHLKNRARARESRFSDDMIEQLAAESESRADAAETRLRALRECLSKLPEPDRALVNARYAAGASVKEMAQAGGRTADALSMHLYRLRKNLAACIESLLKQRGWQT
jgi:RNA polymerase sigma-70 factor (ECF subfamily)